MPNTMLGLRDLNPDAPPKHLKKARDTVRMVFQMHACEGKEDYQSDGPLAWIASEVIQVEMQNSGVKVFFYNEWARQVAAPVSYTHLTLPTTPYV